MAHAQNHSEKQEVVAQNKASRLRGQLGLSNVSFCYRLKGQSGLPNVCVCFVLATSALVLLERDVSQTNMC